MSCKVTSVLSPNGKISQLYNNIVGFTNNIDLAIRIYSKLNTDDFNKWYGNGKRDINNDPIISYEKDNVFIINDKGDKKSIFNKGTFGKQNTKSDIENNLINKGIVHRFNGELRITKGNSQFNNNPYLSIEKTNIEYIDKLNDLYITEFNSPLFIKSKSGKTTIIRILESTLDKINNRNNSNIYYSELTDYPTIESGIIKGKGFFELNSEEIKYANSLASLTVIILLENSSNFKLKNIKNGVTVRKEIVNYIKALADKYYNVNKINIDNYNVNIKIANEIENNDIFWNQIKTYVSNSIGYKIIDISESEEENLDATYSNWGDRSQFKEEPNDRLSKEIKFLLASTKDNNSKSIGGLPIMLNPNDTFTEIVHNLWNSKNVSDMMDKLKTYSNIVNSSLLSFYDKIDKNENLKNLLFTNIKYDRPIVKVLNTKDDKFEDISLDAKTEYQIANEWINNIITRINIGLLNDSSFIKEFNNLKSKLNSASYIEKYNIVSNILSLFNISINPDNLRWYIESNYNSERKFVNVTDYNRINEIKFNEAILDKNKDGVIGILESYLNTDKEFDHRGKILKLAKGVSIFYTPNSSSYSNVEGNLESSFIKSAFITEFANIFDDEYKLNELLSNMAISDDLKYSNWLIGKLISVNGTKLKNGIIKDIDVSTIKIINKLEINRFGGVKFDTGKGKKYTDITPPEWRRIKVSYFFNNSEYFITSPSDKSHTYTIKGFNIGKDIDFDIDNSFRIKNQNHPLILALRNALYQEIHRIDSAVKLVFDESFKVKDEYLQDISKLKQDYHYKLKDGKPIFIENGKPVGNAFKFHQFDISTENMSISANNIFKGNNFITTELLNIEDNVNIINKFISAFSAILIRNEYNNYIDTKEYIESTTNDTYLKSITRFAINTWIANMEMQNFLLGNIAFYGKGITLNKRAMEILSPGIVSAAHGTEETFNAVTINDRIVSSNIINDIKITLETENVNNKVINNILKSYSNINSSDGLSYITLDEYIKRLKKWGLYDRYKNLISKLQDDTKEIDIEDLDQFIQSQKNFYYGYEYDSSINSFYPVQVKNSEFILIPKFIKGTDLELLYNSMINNNIQQVNFESAAKVGANYIAQIVSEDGKLYIDKLDNEFKIGTQKYKYKYLRKQSDTVNHIIDEDNKLNIKFIRKILDNVEDYKIRDLVDQLVYNNVEDSFEILGRELGTIKGKSIIYDKDKLASLLLNEYLNRATNINELIAILKDEITDEFNLPLDSNLIRNKNQSLLLSLFSNNITRQKMPGIHGPQVSNAFMNEIKSRSNISKASELPTYKELKYSKFYNDNGTIKYSKCEILIPYWAKAFISGKENITLEDLQNAGLDEMIGYRQPTEDKHSMILFKVVGILDSSQGSTIIVPDEFVIQTGSDFDIDTIYTMNYHFKIKNGKPEKIQYTEENDEQSIQNRYTNYINYLFKNIINKPDNEYFEEIKLASKKSWIAYKGQITRKRNENGLLFKESIDELFNVLNNDISSDIKRLIFKELKDAKDYDLKLNEQIVYVYNNIDTIIKSLEEEYAYNEKDGKSNAIKAKLLKNMKELEIVKLFLSDIINEFNENKLLISDYITNISKTINDKYWDNFAFNNSINLASKYNFINYDTFKSLPIHKQNNKQARDNKLISIFESILTNPIYYEENISPSGFNDITDAKKYIESILNNNNFINNFNLSSTQDNFRIAAMSGRNLKANSVNRDSFISLAQKLKLKLNNPIYIIDENDKKIELSNFGRSNKKGFNQFKNNDDILITSYVAQSTANILDNVKFPLPDNVNEFSFGVWRLIPELGGNWKTATLLINQPIIKDYINQKVKKNNSFYKGKINDINNTYNIYINKLIDYYKSNNIDLDDILTKDEIKTNTKYFSTKRISEILSSINLNDMNLYESKLIYNIKNNKDNDLDFIKNSLNILYIYLEYENIIKETDDIIRFISQDRKAAVNNFNSIVNFKKYIEFNRPYYINTEYNEDYITSIYTIKEEDSKDKMIYGFNKFSNEAVYDTFKDLFISENEHVRRFIDTYSSRENDIISLDENIQNELISYIHTFNIRTLSFFKNYDFKKLLGITSEFKNLDISDINNINEFKDLSVVNKLILVTKFYKNSIDKEHLLNKLLPIVNSNYINIVGYSGISFNVDKNINRYINDFHNMWYNDNPFIHLLAQDLIRYSFFNDGLNFGKNLSKVIPVEILAREPITLTNINGIDILNGIGYTSEYIKNKNLHYNDDFVNQYNDIFKINFARAKWNNDLIVPIVENETYFNEIIGQNIRKPNTANWTPDSNGIIVISQEDFDKLNINVKTAPVIKQYIKTSNKTKEVKLFAKYRNYKYDENGNVTVTYFYIPVSKLNRYEFTNNSIINKNDDVLPFDYYLNKIRTYSKYSESVKDIKFLQKVYEYENSYYKNLEDYTNVNMFEKIYKIKDINGDITIYNNQGYSVFTTKDSNGVPTSNIGKKIYFSYLYNNIYDGIINENNSYTVINNKKYILLPKSISEIFLIDSNFNYNTIFDSKDIVLSLLNNKELNNNSSLREIYNEILSFVNKKKC